MHDEHDVHRSHAVTAAASTDRLLVGCDFDGTLAPIVGNPMAARPLPGGVKAIASLAALPRTYVAVLSGRSRSDLATLFGTPAGVVLIGSHGAEWGSDLAESLTGHQTALLRRLVRLADEIVSDIDGAFLERKPASVAVHVRRAARRDAAAVLAEVEAGPAQLPGVSVLHGKEVIELCVTDVTKGTAITRLKQLFHPSLTMYLGDDTTDEAAFASLDAADLACKVGPGPSLAGIRLNDPSDVVALLSAVAIHRRSVRQ